MIQDELLEVVRMLRQPAGTDPRFASLEEISVHRTDFLSATHATWKGIHGRALDEILKIEAVLASSKAKRLPPGFSWFLRYNVALWRRINDSLVWSLLGQRDHYIRRLCHRKPRPSLSHANPSTIRRFLDELNSDPLTFALWSDATSCIDVGDVISQSFSGGLSGIFEVKEGKVNERILDLMTSSGDLEAKVQQIASFAGECGEKGIKQLERVVRQAERAHQVLNILETDEGFDPYRGEHIKVLETEVALESYDDVLAEVIERSDEGPVLQCIDDCLWVYVDRDPAKNSKDRVRAFSEALFAQSSAIRRWTADWHSSDFLVGVVPLDGNLVVPEAMPIMLRALRPEVIRDVLLGGLEDRVLLYLDWLGYGHLIECLGAQFTWSSPKVGRSASSRPYAQQTMTVGERVPRIELPDGRFINGQSKIYRTLFEGVRPSGIARQYVEVLRRDLSGA